MTVLAPIIQRFKIQPKNICPAVDFGSRKEFSRRGSLYCPFVLEIIESIGFKEVSKRRFYDCPFALNYSGQQIESANYKNTRRDFLFVSSLREKSDRTFNIMACNVWHVCRSCRLTCTGQFNKQPSQIYATKFKLATSPAI